MLEIGVGLSVLIVVVLICLIAWVLCELLFDDPGWFAAMILFAAVILWIAHSVGSAFVRWLS